MARVNATIGVVQNRPIFTPGVAKAASSAATARSQVATNWHPAAVAMPCTSAITGCGMDCSFIISSVHTSKMRRYSLMSRPVISRKIVAGAEHLAGGGQDHRADLAVAADLVQAGDQLQHQLERKRVAPLRTVQRDHPTGPSVSNSRFS